MAQLKSKTVKLRLLKVVLGFVLSVAAVIVYALCNTPEYVLAHSSENTVQEPSAVPQTFEVQESQTATTTEAQSLALIIVHIDGEVMNPGVYELPEDSRVQAGVDAAGGFTEEADTSSINLAAKLQDGQKVLIPKEGEEQSQESNSSASSVQSSSLVNINTATAEELDSLPGVGAATAEAIIKDREALGAFSSIEDLMRVSGIGEKKYAKLKDYICV